MQSDENIPQSETRETKIINTIVNTSVIIMSVMMDAFANVMVSATGSMAVGMADAVGGKEAEKQVKEEFNTKLPEVNDKMKTLISETRRDIYGQIEQKKAEIKPLLSDAAFDVGPEIIEKYSFSLPRLTEQLDDTSLAKYTMLLVNEDQKFSEMFQELTAWMNSIPKLQKK